MTITVERFAIAIALMFTLFPFDRLQADPSDLNYCLEDKLIMDQQELSQRYAAGERNFSALDLTGISLSYAKLTQANLAQTNLSRAGLNGANLSQANLSRANLYGADLCYADLRGADLTDTDLRCALLLNANLTGAKLNGTNLQWASLTDAIPPNLDLSQAYLSRTVLPGGYPSDGYETINRYLKGWTDLNDF